MASSAALELIIGVTDKASGPLKAITGSLGGLAKIGGAAVLGGAVAGVAGLGAALVAGIGDARQANIIFAQSESVIKATGGAAGVSAQHVADYASSLSAASGTSLFGDDQIAESTNLLLTFKEIKGATLDAATAISVDMAQAMGGAPSDAAIQLGKALNDPIAGISALSRVGVTFSDEQKAMIKTMQEHGDMAGAQAIILKELNSEFGGSAAAAAAADGGMAMFKDRMGELGESIGAQVLPMLNQLMAWLNSPDVQAGINAIVTGLVDGVGAAFAWLSGTAIPMLIAGWQMLQPALATVGEFITTTIVPALTAVATWLQTAIPAAVAVAANVWTTMLQPALMAVGEFITSTVIPALMTLVAWFQGDGTSALAAYVGFFTGIWNQILGVITTVVPAIQSVITTVFGAVSAFLAENSGSIQTIISLAWQTIQVVIQGAMAVITGVIVPAFTAIAGFISSHGAEIQAILQTAWNLVSTIVTTTLNVIQGVVRTVMAVIKGDWSGAWNEIKATAQTLWEGIRSTVEIAINAVKAVIAAVMPTIQSIITTAWEAIKAAAATAWEAIRSTVASKIGEVVALAQALPGQIVGALGNLGSLLLSAGSSIIQGLIDGIKSKIGAVTSVLSSITAMIPKVKGPPEKDAQLLFENGRLIIQGLIDGFGDMKPEVVKELSSITDLIGNVFNVITSGTKALGELAGYKPGLLRDTVVLFANDVFGVVETIQAIVLKFSADGVKAASTWAESAGKVIGIIGSGIDALTKLKTYASGLTRDAVLQFGHDVYGVVSTLQVVVAGFDQDAVAAAAKWSESAGKVVSIIGGAVDGLTKLIDFKAVPQRSIELFGDAIRLAVQKMMDVAQHFDTDGVKAAATFAEATGKIVSPISSAIEAFTKLRDYKGVLPWMFDMLGADIKLAVAKMIDLAQNANTEGVNTAALFSLAVSKVFNALSLGVETLDAIREYKGIPPEAMQSFSNDFQGVLGHMAVLLTNGQTALTQAETWRTQMEAFRDAMIAAVAAIAAIPTIPDMPTVPNAPTGAGNLSYHAMSGGTSSRTLGMMPLATSGGASYATTSFAPGAITIMQQPGEDSRVLASRVADELDRRNRLARTR